MRGFKLDSNGDVAISNNKIEMVEGKELIAQTVQSVLSTNKGEWPLNADEGVNFHNILGKKPKTNKNTGNTERYLENEIKYMHTKDSELAERLRKRLDGTL